MAKTVKVKKLEVKQKIIKLNKKPKLITVSKVNKQVLGKVLLNNINITMYKGDRIAIVGGNGAGKTTLVEAILGIQKISSGSIEYLFEYEKSPLEKVGVQFQEANFPQGLTAQEVLNFFVDKSLYATKERADKLVKRFKMKEFMKTDSSKLSGGQAQKLNVLLALINHPDILVMDELTTGLDVFAKNEIANAVEEYLTTTAASMILVSHTAHEISRLATRVISLTGGQILHDISMNKLKKEFGTVGKFLDKISR